MTAPEQPTPPNRQIEDRWAAKLWLWKNGDHYLAFDSEVPTYGGGDPKTLGEPVGYALLEWETYDRMTEQVAAQRAAEAEGFQCPSCHWHEGHDPAEWFRDEVKQRAETPTPPPGDAVTHYVLINDAGVYVKAADFFVAQGGLAQEWGSKWEAISAPSLYAARDIGIRLRRSRYPHCHKTTGEDGQSPETYWPEARGEMNMAVELNAPQIMLGLKEVQDRLPRYWTDQSYPDSFNEAPLPHRHFNHSLSHAMKALGGLAALSDAMDHERMHNRGYADPEAEQYAASAGKWLADLVICSARMAEQLDLDLDGNVQHRINTLIERWGGK